MVGLGGSHGGKFEYRVEEILNEGKIDRSRTWRETGSTLEGSVKVIYWLNFVHDLKTWQNAKRRCTDMGGKLFFKVSQVRIIEELVKILDWRMINQLVLSPLKKTNFVFKTFSIKFYRSLPCVSTALMALFGTPCIMRDIAQNTSG